MSSESGSSESSTSDGGFLVPPEPAPELNIPASEHVVEVCIVDSGTRLDFPVSAMLVPPSIGSFNRFTFPTWTFLIRHGNKTLLFDLGLRKDWTNLPTKLVDRIVSKDPAWLPHAEWDVVQELEKGGVNVQAGEVDEVIWSHYHWDHTGNMTKFPKSTKLIVGPGFKKRFPVAWPTDPDAPVREDSWAGRDLVEVSFEKDGKGLKIGRFDALDYFGDGSFYLLDLPGHCVAHIGALARTTKDTFIFMGGDASHHAGRLRPSEYLPLPKKLTLDPPPDGNLDAPTRVRFPIPCAGELVIDKLHPKHDATKPFFTEKPGFNDDEETCQWTNRGLVEFDASEDVFMVIAHDPDLKAVIDEYPQTANDWKAKKWGQKGRWRFIGCFADALESS